MKIAITGASGHIGANLCLELHKLNHQFRVLKYREDVVQVEGSDVVEGDVTDRQSLDHFVKDIEVVIHLAARISITNKDRDLVFKTNDIGTRNVVDACIANKVKRLIYFSSIHTFNPHPIDEPLDETRDLVTSRGTPYDLSKMAGEQYAFAGMEHGLEVVVLCPTSVYGPNDHQPSLMGSAIIDIYNGKIPALVPGGYDFVYVEDVIKATIAAIDNGRNGEKYLLSGHYLAVSELANKIGTIGQVKVTQKVLSGTLLKILLPFFQLQGLLAHKPPVLTKESLKTLLESNPYISSAKAAKELGYTKTPVDIAIKKTLDWFRIKGMLKER